MKRLKNLIFTVGCAAMLCACGANSNSIDQYRPGADANAVSAQPTAISAPTAAPSTPVPQVEPTSVNAVESTVSVSEGEGLSETPLRIAVFIGWLAFIVFTQWLASKNVAVGLAIQLLSLIVLGVLAVSAYAYQPSELYWQFAVLLLSVCAFIRSCYKAFVMHKRGQVNTLAAEWSVPPSQMREAKGGRHELA